MTTLVGEPAKADRTGVEASRLASPAQWGWPPRLKWGGPARVRALVQRREGCRDDQHVRRCHEFDLQHEFSLRLGSLATNGECQGAIALRGPGVIAPVAAAIAHAAEADARHVQAGAAELHVIHGSPGPPGDDEI